MTPPDDRTDPFTASDEAFFQAGVASEREPMSERPVTLDAEPPAIEGSDTAFDARRTRFVRPVRSTLIALGLLATVGLVRSLWRTDAADLAAVPPPLVHASANDAPATELADLRRDVAIAEEAGLFGMTLCGGDWASTLASDLPPASSTETTLFGPPAPPDLPPPARPSRRLAEHAKTKPITRAPAQHAARPSRPVRRSAPVTKAALLHALRSS